MVLPSARDELVGSAIGGDQRALARVISLLERREPETLAVVASLPEPTSDTVVAGLTGPPGAGKSCLLGVLASALVERGLRVAAVAVDPSSPLTGGALLGDRLRLPAGLEAGAVYFRSMASRGQRGGMAEAARDVIRLLGSGGFDWVLVESVGVGQVEIDMHSLVEVTVLVLPPGAGDGVQAHKAGILEVADVLCVNKADRPEAAELVRELELVQQLRDGEPTPIVTTVATTGEGVDGLLAAITERRRSRLRPVDALGGRLREAVVAALDERLDALVATPQFAAELEAVAAQRTSIPEAAQRLVASLTQESTTDNHNHSMHGHGRGEGT